MTDWETAGREFDALARRERSAGRDGEVYAMFAVLAHGGAKHERVRTQLRGTAADIVAQSLGGPAGRLARALIALAGKTERGRA